MNFSKSQRVYCLMNAHFEHEARAPVLRIISLDGDERWMPESRDIVRYLQASFG